MEPNPSHITRLIRLREHYEQKFGSRVEIVHAMATTYTGNATFFPNPEYGGGAQNHEWTGGSIQRHKRQVPVNVPAIDLNDILSRYTWTRSVMKMDIEGSEVDLLPHIEARLCHITKLYIEVHNTEARNVLHNVKRRLIARRCPVSIVELDDETPCAILDH